MFRKLIFGFVCFTTTLVVKSQSIDSSDIFIDKAEQARDNKEYQKANIFIDKALSFKAENHDAWLLKSDMYYSLEKYDSALIFIRKVNPEKLVKKTIKFYHFAYGFIFYKNKYYEEALEEFMKLDDENLNSYPVIVKMGYCKYYLGDYDHAITYLKQALTLKEDPYIYYFIGNSYYEKGNQIMAEVWLKKSVEARVNLVLSYNKLSACALAEGAYSQTEEYARKAIEIKPTSYEGNWYLMRVLFAQQRYDELKDPVKIVIEQTPEDPFGNFCLGANYAVKNDTAQALFYLGKGIERMSNRDEKLYLIECRIPYLLQVGKCDQAAADFKLLSDNGRYIDKVDFRLTGCYELIRDSTMARKYYLSALEKYPDDPAILGSYGEFECHSAHFQVAKPYLLKCLAIDSNDFGANFYLSKIMDDENNYAQSIKYGNVALKELPKKGFDSIINLFLSNELYEQMASFSIYSNNPTKALEYLAKYSAIDSTRKFKKCLLTFFAHIENKSVDNALKILDQQDPSIIIRNPLLTKLQLLLLIHEHNVKKFVQLTIAYMQTEVGSEFSLDELVHPEIPEDGQTSTADKDLQFIKEKHGVNNYFFFISISDSKNFILDLLNLLKRQNSTSKSTAESVELQKMVEEIVLKNMY